MVGTSNESDPESWPLKKNGTVKLWVNPTKSPWNPKITIKSPWNPQWNPTKPPFLLAKPCEPPSFLVKSPWQKTSVIRRVSSMASAAAQLSWSYNMMLWEQTTIIIWYCYYYCYFMLLTDVIFLLWKKYMIRHRSQY